jgi:DNA-binding transcriptional MerR regulator
MSTETATDGLLKMRDLAERSGVSAATIKYYLREGVLGSEAGVIRTSRNMAWYPPEFVERIALVKRLQEERYWPLRLIRDVMSSSPEEVARVLETEDRILRRAVEASESARLSRRLARETYDMPREVLDRLEEIGVLSPSARGYDRDDVAIIEAISRFRAGGYEQSLGFTVYDTLRYRDAMAALVVDEVSTLVTRVATQVDEDRALEIIGSADAPLRDLIGAIHSKMLLAELDRRRQDVSRAGPDRLNPLDSPST